MERIMRILLPAAIAASLLFTPVAFASQMASGTVKAFDLSASTVTLADGTQYMLPAGFKDPGLAIGKKVQISWDMKGTMHEATAITLVK
jgi:hypothetical protein